MIRRPNEAARMQPFQRVAALSVWLVGLLALVACDSFAEPTLPDDREVLEGPVGRGRDCTPQDLRTSPMDLRIHFIDVGQGDAIWIQTPDDGVPGNGVAEGYNILIDAGDLGFENRTDGGAHVVRYMQAMGLQPGETIDFAIATHAHSDHYGGFGRVFDVFTVRNVLDPGFPSDSPSYADFLGRADVETRRNGGRLYRPAIPEFFPERYASTDRFGAELPTQILNSRTDRVDWHTGDVVNNSSIVLMMQYAGRRVLFMGDAHWEVESEIANALGALDAHILKVGHHGSRTSSTNVFLNRVFARTSPSRSFAVIPAGRRSFSGVQHPSVGTVFRLQDYVPRAHVFSTEFSDAGLGEREAAGNDHIFAVIESDGSIRMCYNRSVSTQD
ncbi:MAG: MBL fold metallo-hydrolase [Deltaproteobacteria bacterium]|nr:MAG: MBL fold metallo-hydrolase [Deltaproteobacteria bacterium]